MKTSLLTPVTNIDLDVHTSKKHLMEEFAEVAEAWNGWDSKEPKTTAHLVEELIDLATACMTLADRIEKEAQIPQLVNNTLLMVATKNYIRGYHNVPFI